MLCLESAEEVSLHQCALLLQCQAELSLLAYQGFELREVSSQHHHILLQLLLLAVLHLNLTWWG